MWRTLLPILLTLSISAFVDGEVQGSDQQQQLNPVSGGDPLEDAAAASASSSHLVVEQPVESDPLHSLIPLTASLDKLRDVMERRLLLQQQQRCPDEQQNDVEGSSSSSRSLVEHFRSTINLENKLKDLQETVNSLQDKVSSLQEGGGGDRSSSKGLASGGVFFNAVSRKRFSCYGCVITYETVGVDSHNAVNGATGKFVCPKTGHYFLQFHALVENGSEAQLEILVNGSEVIHLYDRDIGGSNSRYAMVGQAFIARLREGDEVCVRLHKGAIKGGGETTFTSFVGMMVGSAKDNEI